MTSKKKRSSKPKRRNTSTKWGSEEENTAENVNETCSSGLDLHYKVVDLGVTSNFVVEANIISPTFLLSFGRSLFSEPSFWVNFFLNWSGEVEVEFLTPQ